MSESVDLIHFLISWLIRIAVLISLGAHLVLVLFAGIRRRKASGVRRRFVKLAYKLTDLVEKLVIGKLVFGSTSHEQQLVAFWEPFLLMHLARPDNIIAYSLKDNKISKIQLMCALAQVAAAIYVLFVHIILSGSGWHFLVASILMFVLGIFKYVERAVAPVLTGELGRIGSSSKKKRTTDLEERGKMIQMKERGLTNDEALQIAHSLFHVGRKERTIGYYPVDTPVDQIQGLFLHEVKDIRKVVEMELSLLYDIMYTKAAVVHNWLGYIIRVASSFFTLAALLLFVFYSEHVHYESRDVIGTYILLAATFLLDVRWLLGALGSTWTYAFLFLNDRSFLFFKGKAGIRRWNRLRRAVVFLDLSRLLLSIKDKQPSSYRMWSGTIGQYNLLSDCTHEMKPSTRQISEGSIDLILFDRILEMLRKMGPKEYDQPLDGLAPDFGVVILIWHIATDALVGDNNSEKAKAIKVLSDYMMFLVVERPSMIPGLDEHNNQYKATRDKLKEIWRKEEGNNYRDLAEILKFMEVGEEESEYRRAYILREYRNFSDNWKSPLKSVLRHSSSILSDGIQFAMVLEKVTYNTMTWDEILRDVKMDRKREATLLNYVPELISRKEVVPNMGNHRDGHNKWTMEKLLEGILDSWVRVLVYSSLKCSVESHAKQLASGGELTTIVWILAAHAKHGNISGKAE